MKLCKDCKWMQLGDNKEWDYARCRRPLEVKIHVVSGLPTEQHLYCTTERNMTGPEGCGPGAIYWEDRKSVSKKSIFGWFKKEGGLVP